MIPRNMRCNPSISDHIQIETHTRAVRYVMCTVAQCNQALRNFMNDDTLK